MKNKRKPHRPNRPKRKTNGHQVIYGVHAARAALANANRTILKVHVSGNMAERLAPALAARSVEPAVLHPRELDRLAGPGAVHQGVVLEVSALPDRDLHDLPATGPLVILDQVTDPHNVGAILRSAAAFSVTALVTTARHSPDGSAILAKTASGAMEHVPIVKVTNLARALGDIRKRGYFTIGLDSVAQHTMEDVPAPAPHAIVLGAEGKGLRRLTRENCDVMARLDLPGAIKSLNVSNAAALALHILSRKS